MEDIENLIKKAELFEERVATIAANRENVLLAAHHDADGLCASAVLSEYILKRGGRSQIRTMSEMNPKFLEKIRSSRFDSVIFLDTCSGLASEISKSFGDKWLTIDHHEIPLEEMNEQRLLNPWQFGIDGGHQISCAGLVHLICRKALLSNSAFLAIVGALGDRQDVGPRRSLVGLNARILEQDSESFKTIESRVDLLFWGRESKPVHESIANAVSTYIPGLTGNKDACLASLRGAGVELKSGNIWRTASSFSEEEKQQILECVLPHLSGTTNTVEDLVGTVYLQRSRDEYSMMRDARDVATLLSACGRLTRSSLGISLCLGSEPSRTNGLEYAFTEYRTELVRLVQTLMSSEERIQERNEYVVIIGDGLVSERMTGAVCQLLASITRAKSKVIFLRTTTSEGDVKVSVRSGRECPKFDLGKMMTRVATATGGVGGGHQSSAGLRFSIIKQQEFQMTVDGIFQNKGNR